MLENEARLVPKAVLIELTMLVVPSAVRYPPVVASTPTAPAAATPPAAREAALPAAMGVDLASWSGWESGRREPSVIYDVKIRKFLGEEPFG